MIENDIPKCYDSFFTWTANRFSTTSLDEFRWFPWREQLGIAATAVNTTASLSVWVICKLISEGTVIPPFAKSDLNTFSSFCSKETLLRSSSFSLDKSLTLCLVSSIRSFAFIRLFLTAMLFRSRFLRYSSSSRSLLGGRFCAFVALKSALSLGDSMIIITTQL